MSKKTKAIIAVIIIALLALCYFFFNTTVAIESFFRKVGIVAIIVLIIAFVVFGIIFINKFSKAKAEYDVKKAKRLARQQRKANEIKNNKE